MKLAGTIMMVVALVATCVYLALSRYEAANLLRSKEAAATMVSRLYVATAAAPLTFGDDKGVQDAVELLSANDEIVHASAWSVVEGSNALGERLGELRRGAFVEAPQSVPAALMLHRTRDELVIDAPVRGPTGKVVGVVQAAFSLARERQALGAMEERILLTSICAALFMTAVLLLVARRIIVQPLARLVAAANALERGAEFDVVIAANDEIGSLATAFVAMSRAIEQRERRIAERNEEVANARVRLQGVLDAATETAIVATDGAGIITVWNSGAAKMLGYSAEDLLGRANPYVELVDAARAADRDAQERTLTRKDGTKLTVISGVTPMRDASARTVGYLGVATDVTARREASEALEVAKESAERAARAKSEFLATMSHEIRTPMNGVLGFTGLLLETTLDPEQRDFVRTIQSSGQALLSIINDVLDFSKFEAGALTLERLPFGLEEAASDVVALLRCKAVEKGLDLQLSVSSDTPARVVADPGRLKQILMNLVGNAIKFTAAGHVRLEVSVTARPSPQAATLRFRVQDTGIGISADARTRLFQKFAQADASTTRRYGGTGLGLAICRQLVDRMGGAIDVESEEGTGSTFWFTLPVDVPVAESPSRRSADAAPAATPQQGRRARVLLVEDNPVNQKLATHMLKRLGCVVDAAWNGAEAVELTARSHYDLVLMDCHMPEMDGFEATRAIRAREAAAGIPRGPIIALTASVLEEDRRSCESAGMDAFVGKPVRPNDLAEMLERFVPAPASSALV